VEFKVEAEIEVGNDAAKVTVPVKTGISFSSSEETKQEGKMAEKDFTFSTSKESIHTLYALKRSTTRKLTSADFNVDAFKRIEILNNLENEPSSEVRFNAAREFITDYGTHYFTYIKYGASSTITTYAKSSALAEEIKNEMVKASSFSVEHAGAKFETNSGSTSS
jgi:hypothetical protein